MLANYRRRAYRAGISPQLLGEFAETLEEGWMAGEAGWLPILPIVPGATLLLRSSLELKLLDAVADLIASQPQQRRGLRLIPPSALECLHDERAFQLFEIDASGRQLHRLAKPDGHGPAR